MFVFFVFSVFLFLLLFLFLSVSLPGDDVFCWLLSCLFLLSAFPAFFSPTEFPVGLCLVPPSCDHGRIRSGSVNVRLTTTQSVQYHGRFLPDMILFT